MVNGAPAFEEMTAVYNDGRCGKGVGGIGVNIAIWSDRGSSRGGYGGWSVGDDGGG